MNGDRLEIVGSEGFSDGLAGIQAATDLVGTATDAAKGAAQSAASLQVKITVDCFPPLAFREVPSPLLWSPQGRHVTASTSA